MLVKYKIEFETNTIIEPSKLRIFIIERIKFYGGLDLLKSVEKVECEDNNIYMTINKRDFFEVHNAMFITEKYFELKCNVCYQEESGIK